MQVQQDVVSSTKALEAGACPVGEFQRLKSERVQLRAESSPIPEDFPDWTILRGRLSIGQLISLSFELDGGVYCLPEDEEPEGEAGGVVPALPPAATQPSAAGKEVDRARS